MRFVVNASRVNAEIVQALLMLFMTVLGGIVSGFAFSDPLAKIGIIIAFVFLGGCSGWMLYIQARQAAKAEAGLREQMQANFELHGKLVELTEANAELTRQNAEHLTGGDSFCFISFNFQFGYACPVFVHSGKYTVFDVHARIIDLNRMRQNVARRQPAISDSLELPLGELPPGRVKINERFSISFIDENSQAFNIFFSARNGMWTELLRLRNVNGTWRSAIRVTRQTSADGSPVTLREPIFERIDEEYPRKEDGTIDWE